MTREEAIEQLQNCKDLITQDGQDYLDDRDIPLLDLAIEALSANRPTVVHCRECVRKKNCWMFNEHKDDNGTCVWAELYYITESPNDVVEQKNDVVAEPTDLISRADAVEQIKEWAFGQEFKYTNATEYLLKRIASIPSADRQSGEWVIVNKGLDIYICDQCGEVEQIQCIPIWGYCPNCGAKMKTI